MIAQNIREGNGLRSHLAQAPQFVSGLTAPESLGDLLMAIPPVGGRARAVHNSDLFIPELFYFVSMPLCLQVWLALQQH